jgi:hypothetical protein
MTTENMDGSQSVIEDGSGVGGPGAPTPLSALEVSRLVHGILGTVHSNHHEGRRWVD